jgi:single-strand DNA-binding protein
VCYIDIVVFGKQAEHCGQYLSKGHGVIVDGRLQQRRWETDDGQKRSKHEVVAQSINFLPKRQDQAGTGGLTTGKTLAVSADAAPSEEFADQDVPF